MKQPVAANKPETQPAAIARQRALWYLAPRVDAIDEPYLIASYALAAIDAGNMPEATRAAAKLRTLAHTENGGQLLVVGNKHAFLWLGSRWTCGNYRARGPGAPAN